MLSAAQAEILVRMTPGRVRQGGSAAQSFGMELMTYSELVMMINSLTSALGLNTPTNLVAPNFNSNPTPLYTGSTFGA